MRTILLFFVLTVFLYNYGYSQAVSQEWVVYPAPQSLNTIHVKENQLYVDDSLNVYTGGLFYDTSFFFYESWGIAKINSSGIVQWYAIEPGMGIVSGKLAAIAVDSGGNVYASGSINFNTGIVRAQTNKYNMNGQLEWTRVFDSIGGMGIGYGNFVSSDNYCYEHVRNSNITVRKFDPSGNVIQQFSNDTILASQNHAFIASEFKRDNENNIYIAGTYVDTPNFSERKYFVKKFNALGALQWESFYNPTSGSDNPTGLFIDDIKNVYLVGTENVSAGYGIVVYDSTGLEKWHTLFQINGIGYADDIVADDDGNCYVNGVAPFSSVGGGVLLKYDTSGGLIWQRNIDSVSSQYAKVKLDANSNVYVAYDATGSLPYDVVTAKYDSAGNLIWTAYYDHPQNTTVTALALDKLNNVYIAGDGFVVKYSQTTGMEEIQPDGGNITIYPNPVQGNNVYFSCFLNKVSIALYDGLGRQVIKREKFTGNRFEWPVWLRQGIYVMEIQSRRYSIRRKIIINMD